MNEAITGEEHVVFISQFSISDNCDNREKLTFLGSFFFFLFFSQSRSMIFICSSMEESKNHFIRRPDLNEKKLSSKTKKNKIKVSRVRHRESVKSRSRWDVDVLLFCLLQFFFLSFFFLPSLFALINKKKFLC